mmetsp:Transcript_16888/g.31986  ORF Transcript_16888/g.31986 Transcript_16888/m.31986 type:complete len:390 (-) Transcript_16888:133-1302(-)
MQLKSGNIIALSVKKSWRSVISLILVIVTANIYVVYNSGNNGTNIMTDVGSEVTSLETTTKYQIHSDLRKVSAGEIWTNLVDEAVAYRQENNNITMNLMEVGMHTAIQCLHIAKNQLQAYCVEPSPKSTKRIRRRFRLTDESVRKRVRFFEMAASSESGVDLKFHSGGGTGDYVGDGVDVWHMKKIPRDVSSPVGQDIKSVIVKSVAIDDIINEKVAPTIDYTDKTENQNHLDKMFAIKIDTQGFEPSVFSGLVKTIQEHKVDFIMTEFWPKGIDFMNDSTEKCQKPVEILQLLAKNGFQLFAMSNEGHASSLNPSQAKRFIHDSTIKNKIPYHDLREFCMWFYKVEEMFPSPDYKMGYWTDVLAVSPNARLAKMPVSDLGRLLYQLKA